MGAILFAFMNLFARIASTGASWSLIGGTRALLGALVAISVARLRGAPLRSTNQRGMWPRSLFGTAAMLCTFYALARKELPLGDTVTLLNLYPIFIAALSPAMLGERPNAVSIGALATAVVGVVLILHPPILFGGESHLSGAFISATSAVGASVFASFAMIALRKLSSKETPEAVALHFSLTAAASFAVLTLFTWSTPSLHDVVSMVLAGVCAGIAQIAMTKAYSLGEAAHVSAFGYLAVVVSSVLGAIGLHEWPKPSAVVGMILVVLSGFAIAFSGMRGGAKEA